MIGFPLQVEVTYCDEVPRESVFHHGRSKFVFRNLSSEKALRIHLPPLAVYLEVQANNFQKLEDRARWPKFTRQHRVLTLPPTEEHVFEESYESLGSTAPGWCFVFGPGDGVHEPHTEVYVGCVVAPGRRNLSGSGREQLYREEKGTSLILAPGAPSIFPRASWAQSLDNE